MARGNKQIGWSEKSNLLWEISKELDRTLSLIGGQVITTTTTTTIPTGNFFTYTPDTTSIFAN